MESATPMVAFAHQIEARARTLSLQLVLMTV